ncbi:heterokaryon incompatibility protein-domain-containing protein [Paraphoma chrysanthemicola]|nr:heterokaryon incompatibility protein-domain-containing protein [Paraphoma chrysanthemicola]
MVLLKGRPDKDDKTIKYKALSYVWGDSAETESIYIDGTVKNITKSCASALRRVLLTQPGVRIWADPICIDQGNDVAALTERGQQVAVMDEIYGSAVEVFIYLGEGNASTRKMFRTLRKIYTALLNMQQASTPDDYNLRLGYEHPAPNYTRDFTDLDLEVAYCFLKYDRRLNFLMTMPAIALTECIESWWQMLDRAKGVQYPHPMTGESVLYHIDGQAFDHAAAELMILAKFSRKEGVPAERLEAIMSHFTFIRNKTAQSDLTERKTLVLPNEAEGRLHKVGSGYVLSDSIHILFTEISGYCGWKALELSSKGYMAMFPYGSEVGDKIVVLHGAEAPLVIRPVDGAYQYVGPAYVQGIMSGEFWETGTEDDDIWFDLI